MQKKAKKSGFINKYLMTGLKCLCFGVFIAIFMLNATLANAAAGADAWKLDSNNKINVDTSGGTIGTDGGDSAREKGTSFLNRLIMFSAAVAAVGLMFIIIVNGLTIINNDKGPEALKTASKNIALSVAGLALSASAFFIVDYLGKVMYGSNTYFTDPVATIGRDSASGTTMWEKILTAFGIWDWIAPFWGYNDYSGNTIASLVPTTSQSVFGSVQPLGQSGGLARESITAGPVSLINAVAGLLVLFASVWLLVAIIWNGYKIITSQSSDVLSKAVRNVGISIIGFLIAVLAYAITDYVVHKVYQKDLLDDPVKNQLEVS